MLTPVGGREWVTTLLLHALVLLLAYLVYLVLRPFLVPLGWAAVLVIFCYPSHLELRARWGRSRAAAASTLALTLMLIVPGVLVTSAFIAEAGAAFGAVRENLSEETWAPRFAATVGRFVPKEFVVEARELAARGAQQIGGWVAAGVGTLLQNTAIFVFHLVVTIFAAFFLFRDGDKVIRALRTVLPLEASLRERLLTQIHEVINAAVTSSFIVAAVQGLLGGVAFWVLDITAPVFWGVVMALFCLLPLGAWVVWLPAAIWLIATGHPGRGILLIALGAGVVSAVDNFLRPMLLSGRTRLNGLLMFISLLGGVAAFGLLGLMLGPVVMATGLGLFEAYATEVERARARDEVVS
ncbi:MAG TPA: AI-2E family transporter [Vicinamibacterales bacterium]|nr:AI-2E family transporter [Vicinamibacterales bacterium]